MKQRWFLSLLTFLALGALLFVQSCDSPAEPERVSSQLAPDVKTSCRVFIHSSNPADDYSILQNEGYDVLRDRLFENGFEAIVSPAEYSALLARGHRLDILQEGRPFREIQADRSATLDLVPTGYPDYATVISEMTDYAANYPAICAFHDLTDQYGMSTTYEGNHIYALKISDNAAYEENEPSFLMVSCHHAREIVTPVIALYSIDQLLTNYGSDPEITDLVDNYEIWISPVWNPDGYEYVFEVNNYWRKNRQPYDGYFGVDLNRNYPFGWDSYCSGSIYPYSETYKGPSAASEVETQTMVAFHDDQNFTKLIDYHSYGREVLYEYACHVHPFVEYLYDEAVLLSQQAGYLGYVRSPSSEGENFEWQLARYGTYAFLMETHYDFQPVYSSAVAEAELVWPATIWMLEREIPVSGNVTDYVTGNPLVADINILDVTFGNGELFKSEPLHGRYHLFLPPGTYDIEFSKLGYDTEARQVTVSSGQGQVVDVALTPPNDPPEAPFVLGPKTGMPKTSYTFTFESDDPDGDDVYYYVDWGDDSFQEWIGPYASGQVVSLDHSWNKPGNITIEARARDIYEQESDVGEARIKITRKKQT